MPVCFFSAFSIKIRHMRFFPHSLILLLGLLAGAPAVYAEEEPSVFSTASNLIEQAGSTVQEVLVSALALTGTPYKYGGKTPETGFDCSGFVKYVFQQATNLTLPHGARAISQLGKSVQVDQLQPGDLVFFNTLKSAFSHVGIYIGDNRFVHAPSSGGGVHVVNMTDSYWAKRFNGARRIETGAQQPPATSDE
jgi:cell wall-associated NlpC family hydrolase